jgi:hypothetical protein
MHKSLPAWKKLAEAACTALNDLYQAIGAEHTVSKEMKIEANAAARSVG